MSLYHIKIDEHFGIYRILATSMMLEKTWYLACNFLLFFCDLLHLLQIFISLWQTIHSVLVAMSRLTVHQSFPMAANCRSTTPLSRRTDSRHLCFPALKKTILLTTNGLLTERPLQPMTVCWRGWIYQSVIAVSFSAVELTIQEMCFPRTALTWLFEIAIHPLDPLQLPMHLYYCS